MAHQFNWRLAREFTRRTRVSAQASTNDFGAYGRPIKLRREPESYFHQPVTERVKTDRLLPKLKFLERPDP